jgi:serine/threonine protein kinase
MVEGRLPFNGRDASELMSEILFAPVRYSLSSKSCRDLISKLLEKNPVKRLGARDAAHHPWVLESPWAFAAQDHMFQWSDSEYQMLAEGNQPVEETAYRMKEYGYSLEGPIDLTTLNDTNLAYQLMRGEEIRDAVQSTWENNKATYQRPIAFSRTCRSSRPPTAVDQVTCRSTGNSPLCPAKARPRRHTLCRNQLNRRKEGEVMKLELGLPILSPARRASVLVR